MTSRKVMRGAELRRIGNDLVLIDRYPDGTKQTLARPIEEWLIIKAWIEELSEDHDGAVAPDPHPSPEERAETGEAGGCTRTRDVIGAWATFACTMFELSPIEKAVLTTMAAWSDDSWRCRLPIKAIAQQANVDRKSVFAAIEGLKTAPLIKDSGEREGQTKQVVVYKLLGGPVKHWPPRPVIIDDPVVTAIEDGEVRRA